MANVRHLPRAPVTEALIDLRVQLPEGFDVGQFDPLPAPLRDRFPLVERREGMTTHIDLERGHATAAKVELHGLHFRSADRLELAQFRRDGFTLNRLHPYTSFDELLPVALDLWDHYATVAGVAEVERASVRFINHIKILPTASLEDHIEQPPAPPPGGLPVVARFLEKFVLLDPDSEVAANLTRSLEGRTDDKVSVLIDVDVYKRKRIPAGRAELEPVLQELRSVKNEIFFGSITETTARMYE